MPHEYDDPIYPDALEAAIAFTLELSSRRQTTALSELATEAVNAEFCTCVTTAADAAINGRAPVHAALVTEVLRAVARRKQPDSTCAMQIERPDDVPLAIPSLEALRMATAAIRRGYVLPETMEHPEVRSQCLGLVSLIQAYGWLLTKKLEQNHDMPNATIRGSTAFQHAPRVVSRASGRHRQDSPDTSELVDA